MSKALDRLKRDARESEMQVIERDEPGGLHIIVVGERVVHWWPDSRGQTAYVEGSARGEKYATPQKVIQLAKVKT